MKKYYKGFIGRRGQRGLFCKKKITQDVGVTLCFLKGELYMEIVCMYVGVSKFVAENVFNNVILNSTMNATMNVTMNATMNASMNATMNATMNLTNSNKGLKQNYLFSSGFLFL